MKKSLDVAVLMGGFSDERDVSLKSGKAVAKALLAAGHSVRAVDVVKRDLAMLEKHRPDVVFIALHGAFGEDGGVQAVLEQMHLPYTGSGPTASYVGMDKIESKRLFVTNSIPTPDYFVVRADDDLGEVIRSAGSMGYPVVCKPARGGSSCGVTIARDSAELVAGVCKALDHDARVLVERRIKGRELTVGVLDGIGLPVIEIVADREFFDYDAKYFDEETQYLTRVNLEPAVRQRVVTISERAFEVLGSRQLARVDLIYGTDGQVYVLELNSIPGMTERSLLPMAARMIGLEFIDLCSHLVEDAYYGKKISTRIMTLQDEEMKQVG